MWQQSGIGDYQPVADYSFEFYPPPYNFLAPQDSRAIPPPVLPIKNGLGCGGSDCGCGCKSKYITNVPQWNGLGQGLFNTGLFTSANPSTWGLGEWAAVGVGLYFAGSLIGDVGRGASAAGKRGKRLSRKARKAATSAAGLTFGSAFSVIAVAAIAYFGYQWVQGQQAPASTAVATQ